MKTTAAQKAMAKAAKQITAAIAALDAVRFEDGHSDIEKGRMSFLVERLYAAQATAENGANPIAEGPSMSEQRAAYIASH